MMPALQAQDSDSRARVPRAKTAVTDTAKVTVDPLFGRPPYAWRLDSELGLRSRAQVDTLFTNYSLRFVPSGLSAAYATTGNYGAQGMQMLYHLRPQTTQFFFTDALHAYLPHMSTQLFYNTLQPITLMSYNFGGNKDSNQDRLRANLSGNFNRRAQFGAMVDYLYSKGSYAQQAVKDLQWGFNGSYMGERYEFQGFYYHYNSVNKESGGITDTRWITDPAALQGGVESVDPKAIPTRLSDAHTRVVGEQLLLNNRYKLGYRKAVPADADSTAVGEFVPVSSLIWTLDYTKARHSFVDRSSESRDYFSATYYDPTRTDDRTEYWRLRNVAGIALLEGWKRLAKFDLTAYAAHELRRYTQTADSMLAISDAQLLTPLPEYYRSILPRTTQNLLSVGARITKQRGSVLTYKAGAELGLIGDEAGDVHIDGELTTRIRVMGDTTALTAYGRFDNSTVPYLLRRYRSNHLMWYNDFGTERRLSYGGRLQLPRTGTRLMAGMDNLNNAVYFGPDFKPTQYSGIVTVLTARVEQDLHLGPLHWCNAVTYQKSSRQSVIPLPDLAVYSNLYFLFNIATLHVQAGMDCDYYTRYYAPKYQPATASMANQQEVKLGNYPFMNLYLNMKLDRARFYVMLSHVNQGLFGRNYFSVVDYPLNPRRLQLGLSVDFAN